MHFLNSDVDGWDGCNGSNGYFRRTLAAPAKDFCQVNANAVFLVYHTFKKVRSAEINNTFFRGDLPGEQLQDKHHTENTVKVKTNTELSRSL